MLKQELAQALEIVQAGRSSLDQDLDLVDLDQFIARAPAQEVVRADRSSLDQDLDLVDDLDLDLDLIIALALAPEIVRADLLLLDRDLDLVDDLDLIIDLALALEVVRADLSSSLVHVRSELITELVSTTALMAIPRWSTGLITTLPTGYLTGTPLDTRTRMTGITTFTEAILTTSILTGFSIQRPVTTTVTMT